MGSGLPGGRCAYADAALNPKYDWQKFEYTYRVWGRLTYDPAANPYGWRRYLVNRFQGAAATVEAALANASRILPLITTAHGASASNNAYWPEIYTNMPIVDAGRKHPYGDTPAPKVFANVSPFDPQLFSSIAEYAAELLGGERSAKVSPLDVAVWLENAASAAKKNAGGLRIATDISIQAGIGHFFAWKMRSALLWTIYERSGDASAGEEALKAYRTAREAWAALAATARPIYAADISYGPQPHLRGNWADRLPAIDEDIEDMARRLRPRDGGTDVSPVIRRALSHVPKRPPKAVHTPPAPFTAGESLPLEVAFEGGDERTVRIHYRRVNQAEPWLSAPMEARGGAHRAAIPGEYTRSPYPLQYYFEVREKSGDAALYPGFETDLTNQPYFVVRLRKPRNL